MITTTIKKELIIKQEIYPCLKIYDVPFKEFVVLFTNPGSGMVIHVFSPNVSYKVGYSSGWDMTKFKPFKDKIILENDEL